MPINSFPVLGLFESSYSHQPIIFSIRHQLTNRCSILATKSCIFHNRFRSVLNSAIKKRLDTMTYLFASPATETNSDFMKLFRSSFKTTKDMRLRDSATASFLLKYRLVLFHSIYVQQFCIMFMTSLKNEAGKN